MPAPKKQPLKPRPLKDIVNAELPKKKEPVKPKKVEGVGGIRG